MSLIFKLGQSISKMIYTMGVYSTALTKAYISFKNLYHYHDDVVKWRHFPRYWLFGRGTHRSPVNSPHKSQWRGALVLSLICAWINALVNTRAHCDVIVKILHWALQWKQTYISLIAQIAPLSFQGSHRTQTQTCEMRWLHASVVTEWSPACLHKQFLGDLHRGS